MKKKITTKSLFPDFDEIPGFSIPIKELTTEELLQDLTLERIQDFHYEAGEDLCDTLDINTHVAKLITGYVMCKYPDLAEIFHRESNGGDIQGLMDVYNCHLNDENSDKFYSDFCEVINCTEITKARINQVLIQVKEHYAE